MITNEPITESHDTKIEFKILFSKFGSGKERTRHVIKYGGEKKVGTVIRRIYKTHLP